MSTYLCRTAFTCVGQLPHAVELGGIVKLWHGRCYLLVVLSYERLNNASSCLRDVEVVSRSLGSTPYVTASSGIARRRTRLPIASRDLLPRTSYESKNHLNLSGFTHISSFSRLHWYRDVIILLDGRDTRSRSTEGLYTARRKLRSLESAMP